MNYFEGLGQFLPVGGGWKISWLLPSFYNALYGINYRLNCSSWNLFCSMGEGPGDIRLLGFASEKECRFPPTWASLRAQTIQKYAGQAD